MLKRTQEEIISNWPKNISVPVVSIRCFAYNHEPYIAQALEGFLMQETNFPFEIIIHDDASTDKTAEIIRKYENLYPKIIKPIYEAVNQYSKHDGSLRKIMNAACKGKYYALCEGDDYWIDPHKLQIQVDWLESHPDYTMCCSDAIIESPDGILDWHRYENNCDIPVEDSILGGGVFIQTATLVYRKDILNNYPDACKNCHVGDTPLRLWASLNGKVHYFSKKTTVYRYLHPGGWTNNQKKTSIDKLIPCWKSEIDMLNYLDSYSKKVYTKSFHRRKEIYLYSLLKTHKKYWHLILKNINIGEASIRQKLELFFMRLGWESIANSFHLLTQKEYKLALYSLPILRKIIPFVYYNIVKAGNSRHEGLH